MPKIGKNTAQNLELIAKKSPHYSHYSKKAQEKLWDGSKEIPAGKEITEKPPVTAEQASGYWNKNLYSLPGT